MGGAFYLRRAMFGKAARPVKRTIGLTITSRAKAVPQIKIAEAAVISAIFIGAILGCWPHQPYAERDVSVGAQRWLKNCQRKGSVCRQTSPGGPCETPFAFSARCRPRMKPRSISATMPRTVTIRPIVPPVSMAGFSNWRLAPFSSTLSSRSVNVVHGCWLTANEAGSLPRATQSDVGRPGGAAAA